MREVLQGVRTDALKDLVLPRPLRAPQRLDRRHRHGAGEAGGSNSELVRELPEPIQALVRAGRLCPHIAAKALVPMARANREDACRLAASIARLELSTREAAQLYAGYVHSGASGRELLLDQPEVYLRAAQAVAA